MKPKLPKSTFDCDEKYRARLQACITSSEDKTICYDDLRKCLTAFVGLDQHDRKTVGNESSIGRGTMSPYTIFPDREIQGGKAVSDTFRPLGIHSFLEACRYVQELPYRYNSDRDDPMILFKERFGSCTTKHAAIASLARELGIPITRGVGIYPMTEAIVTGTGRITAHYELPYVPMIHCFLEYEGCKVDLTEGNHNGKNGPVSEFLFTQSVDANIPAKAEYLIYRNALKGLVTSRDELRGIDIRLLLHAREEGIKLLRANIGQA